MTGALDIVAGFPIGQIGYLINGIILRCIQFDRKADSIYGDANHQSELIIYTWSIGPKSPLQNLQKAILISYLHFQTHISKGFIVQSCWRIPIFPNRALELYLRQFPIRQSYAYITPH